MLLVTAHGARNVVGVDTDDASLEHARELAKQKGVSDRLEFRKVAPGPLLLEEDVFDFAISKDAIVHVSDKATVFADLFRVIRPGGVFIIISDWFCSEAPESLL